ncbi:MAG: hypothetical protein LBO03_06815 [Acidaminococcales bacterium]|jgi:hypothetical protein|nr:hypothetical protein [Acidaminococcales bacterium]
MSHTLHRQGTADNLSGDYVLLAMSAKGVNAVNSSYALKDFFSIINKHDWANMGEVKVGGAYIASFQDIVGGVRDTSVAHAVFRDKDEFARVIAQVKKADLGLSVTISGLLGNLNETLEANGIKPHTVEVSLGIKGKTERLPHGDLLQITTMCGHGMVSQALVRKTLVDIKRGRVSLEKAANLLATPCACGIFNPRRAQLILEELMDTWCTDEP